MDTVLYPSLEDEEVVTTTGLNLRDGPGKAYKVILTVPKWTILWPQQKTPTWKDGKPVLPGGGVSEWLKVAVLTPVGAEARTGFVTGHCWIGTEKSPTFVYAHLIERT